MRQPAPSVGGRISLKVVRGRDRETLHKVVETTTADEIEAYFTDDWAPWDGIADEDTRHETVNHSIEEWVRGDVHTNSVEAIWSLLKRSIIGAYHKVSVKHLDAYLDELRGLDIERSRAGPEWCTQSSSGAQD